MEEIKTGNEIIEKVQEGTTDDEKKWCVYCHTSPSGKKYIGITGEINPERRWGLTGNGYLRRKPNGEFQQPAIANAILKYNDWNEWEHEILLSGLTKKESEEKEMEFIELYNSQNPECGYNITPGGNVACGKDHPMYGKHHTQEARDKMSKARKGTIEGQLNPNFGKSPKEWMSEDGYKEWKEKLCAVSKKNWESEDFRQKMAESMKKYWDENPERKEQLRESQLGEKSWLYGKTMQEILGFDEEKIQKWKEKLGNAARGEKNFWYGKHLPEETRRKISNSKIERGVAKGENNPMWGKHHSDATKNKISKALTGKYSGANNKNNKAVFCIELNKIFYSAIHAQSETGVYSKNIGACCRHYRDFNTAGGYRWCFCNDYVTKDGNKIPGAISLGYVTEDQVNDYFNELKGKEE